MEGESERQHTSGSKIASLPLAIKSPLQKEVAEARDDFLTDLGFGGDVSASLHSLVKRMSKNQPCGVNLCITYRWQGHGCCKLTPHPSSTIGCCGS